MQFTKTIFPDLKESQLKGYEEQWRLHQGDLQASFSNHCSDEDECVPSVCMQAPMLVFNESEYLQALSQFNYVIGQNQCVSKFVCVLCLMQGVQGQMLDICWTFTFNVHKETF